MGEKEMSGLHNWEFACKTPSGADAGDDDIFVCTQCGEETDDTERKRYCPTPDKDAQRPDCKPHPRHRAGKCRFACGCKTDNEPVGANK